MTDDRTKQEAFEDWSHLRGVLDHPDKLRALGWTEADIDLLRLDVSEALARYKEVRDGA